MGEKDLRTRETLLPTKIRGSNFKLFYITSNFNLTGGIRIEFVIN